MDLKELGCAAVNWIQLVQERGKKQALVKTIMNLWVP
jgi:hypothetical protein